MTSTLDLQLRNFARGGQAYWAARYRAFELLKKYPEQRALGLPTFLNERLFTNAESGWQALTITSDDFDALSYLIAAPSASITQNYVSFVLQYIRQNAKVIAELESAGQEISNGVLSDQFVDPDEVITTPLGRQSLLYFRATAAFHAIDPRRVVEKLGSSANSRFVVRSYVRTLTYATGSNVSEDVLELQLSYVARGGKNSGLESAVLRYLISDELSKDYPLAFKCYLALLAHPYDALHMLLGHFERIYAASGSLHAADLERLARIDDVSSPRLKRLVEMGIQQWPLYKSVPESVALLNSQQIPKHFHDYFLTVVKTSPFSPSRTSVGLLAAFDNMRATRYPERIEFDIVGSYISRYRFTDAGKFIESLMNALYLLPRMDTTRERIVVIRLIQYIGCICPFIIAAPEGRALLDSPGFAHVRNGLPGDPPTLMKRDYEPTVAFSDRLWLQALHHDLYEPIRQGQMTVWSRALRADLPIEPGYLSGVKWEWFEDVLKAVRVGPFRGSADGIFALLWQVVENKKSDTGTLRVAIEPIAQQRKPFQSFSDWLFEEYGAQAICFFQYFINAGTIMKLRFTENYFEALSERSVAIERYVQQFGYSALFTEEQFARELEQFETELMLLQVGANQFEISWSVLTADATVKLDDVYKAVKAFESRPEDKGDILGEAKVDYDHLFDTGVHFTCSIRAKDAPLATLITGLIQAFMQHPSQGIESILSVRIRHLNFRRQFEQAFQKIRHQPTFPVPLRNTGCMDDLERSVFVTVQIWLDTYLHQMKYSKPLGAFNFVPSNEEITSLIFHSRGRSISEVCTIVFSWLGQRLEDNLQAIRDELLQKLRKECLEALDAAEQKAKVTYPTLSNLVPRLVAELHTTVVGLISTLAEWFRTATIKSDAPTTPAQMALVLRGRYQSDIEQKRLILRFRSESAPSFPIARQQVRTVFDLCCEVINNCLRYGTKPHVYLNAIPFTDPESEGLIFTSTHEPPLIDEDRRVAGSPINFSNPALFREGKTGLQKIAALAASIAGRPVEISVTSSKKRYSVKVPLRVKGDCNGR